MSPSASEAVGWNEYACPAITEVGGLPLITGARLAASTRMLNAGSELIAMPSLTEIRTLLKDPTLLPLGVPDRRPVCVLKVAQDGRPVIE